MKRELIKERRIELGMTLEELGKSIGVKRPTINRYENGTIKDIPAEKVKKLCDALIISPQELMGWEESDGDANIISLLQEIKKELQDIHSTLKLKETIIKGVISIE